MSGTLAGNPLMTSVDSSIPLRAGQGVAQVNPLAQVGQFADTLGKINSVKLQGQQLQSGTMSLWQQQKQAAYAQIAPLVAQGRINSTSDLTTALAGIEANGGVTAPFVKDMVDSLGQGGDFISNLKAQTVAGTQPPEKAVGALAPVPGAIDTGGQIIPTLTPAPGMAGQGVPAPSAAGFARGYTPGEQLGGIHRPATQADVDASGGRLTLGQDIIVPQTTIPASGGYNPGVGGNRVPVPGLGSGGYSPPQRPLTQLGAPYTPPATPGAMPGSRIMHGPGGTFSVPPDKIAIFQQNGYQ